MNLYEKSLAGKAPQTTQVKMQQILTLTQKMLLKPEKIPTSEYLHREAVQLVRKKGEAQLKKKFRMIHSHPRVLLVVFPLTAQCNLL